MSSKENLSQPENFETSTLLKDFLPKEVKKVSEDAKLFISNNDLHRRLQIRNDSDILVFNLSFEERLLREEIIKVAYKTANLNKSRIPLIIKKELEKKNNNKLERLYKSKEILSSAKEGLINNLPLGFKNKAHMLELAANDLFARVQTIHGRVLMPETILDDYIIINWANAWQENIHEEAA